MNSDQVFDIVEKIACQSGHSKIRFLTPKMEKYLLAAYNPYIRYYTKRTETPKYIGTGNLTFHSETWDILRDLSDRTLSGDLATEIVNTHLSLLTPKSSRLFIRILNKDLRFGLGAKSINKALPSLIPIHDVMLAKEFIPYRLRFPCFASPKIDGVRSIFKNGEFYSRNGHIYPGLSTLKAELKNIFGTALIPDLDGELTVMGLDFNTGSGLIRRGTETPKAVFSIFELPSSASSFPSRLVQMKDIHGITPLVTSVEHIKVHNMDEVMDFYQACRHLGYEGSVIKPFDYKYKGTRSYTWMKMKDILSADVRVLAIEEGKGKYEGQMGKVVVDFNGVKVRVGSGFTDYERQNYYDNPELIVGHVIETLYMEKTPDGSMRHPRYHCHRPDKE